MAKQLDTNVQPETLNQIKKYDQQNFDTIDQIRDVDIKTFEKNIEKIESILDRQTRFFRGVFDKNEDGVVDQDDIDSILSQITAEQRMCCFLHYPKDSQN